MEAKYGNGVFLKPEDWRYLLEEIGFQVVDLALGSVKGLGDYDRIKAGQKRGNVEEAKFGVWTLVSAAVTWQMDK